MIQQYKKYALLLLFTSAIMGNSFGQNQFISLAEAIEIAKKNHAALDRDRLNMQQYQQLAKAGLPLPPSQISISGEELGANGAANLHSLNFQQNFYLPKASKIQQNYFEEGAKVAAKELVLTEKTLEWKVKNAYFQLLYAKEEQALVAENLTLFKDFLQIATTQLQTGETGKIPQLAARTRLGQAQLEAEHVEEKFQIAFSLFNQWLQSESGYDVSGKLTQTSSLAIADNWSQNPHLQTFQALKERANAAIELEKSKLLPQITTGAKLQTAAGNFPLFGYQLGLNVPLFKKNYQNRIEAAEVGVKVQEAALAAEQQKLTRTISNLKYRIEHQAHILNYLQNDLQPLIEEQSQVNELAYREGEISYLEYLNSLEQVVLVKRQFLKALLEYNLLQSEVNYWLGL
jgi:cobalt-zinc-cadmium resistance protein CzcA